jgi:hypothetical protein
MLCAFDIIQVRIGFPFPPSLLIQQHALARLVFQYRLLYLFMSLSWVPTSVRYGDSLPCMVERSLRKSGATSAGRPSAFIPPVNDDKSSLHRAKIGLSRDDSVSYHDVLGAFMDKLKSSPIR